jgi:hypothetical protein
MAESSNPFDDVPVIFSYSRKQALEDGVLVDLTPWASQAGFVIPVACTHAVWHEFIVPPQPTGELGQSERGRAHDLLWMLFLAIRRERCQADTLLFKVIVLMAEGKPIEVELKAICGPGDTGEPVLTILRIDED